MIRMINLSINSVFHTVNSEVDESGVFPCLIRDHTFIQCCVLHCGCYNYQGA